jgi:uncharacterized protein YndB with AHSA1/START domain
MPSVTREITIPVDPEEAWADVSEADRLREWLDDAVDDWEVRECDPGRRIHFTTGDTEIVFTVEAVPDGTRVRVTETGPVLVGPRLQALALCPA